MPFLIKTNNIPMDEQVQFCSTWEAVVVFANLLYLDEIDPNEPNRFSVNTLHIRVRRFLAEQGYTIYQIPEPFSLHTGDDPVEA